MSTLSYPKGTGSQNYRSSRVGVVATLEILSHQVYACFEAETHNFPFRGKTKTKNKKQKQKQNETKNGEIQYFKVYSDHRCDRDQDQVSIPIIIIFCE